jgi:putative PIN family toxin of toxin-antitoxin system
LKRLVIDASTLVSGADPQSTSPPSLIFNDLTEARFEFIVCPRLLAEVESALRKPYFQKRITDEEANEIVAAIEAAAIVREDPFPIEPTLRDPTDDYLVALARESDAEAIVTSDRDLLEHAGLKPPAISPREACERLGLTETAEQ